MEPKGNEYILVGYSEESKAYRFWKSRTTKVIKHRDVRFNEKLSEENKKTNEYFEAFLNMFKTITKPPKIEQKKTRITQKPMKIQHYNIKRNHVKVLI